MAAAGRRCGTGPSDVICDNTDDTAVTLAALTSRATTSFILGGDGSGVSFWRLRQWAARFEGCSLLTSLLDGSVSQSGTATPDLGVGGGRGGEGD